tara:strand:+ start:1037 stop:1249 length:213 start_codon:yes stop_codon:yes gene_type:complete
MNNSDNIIDINEVVKLTNKVLKNNNSICNSDMMVGIIRNNLMNEVTKLFSVEKNLFNKLYESYHEEKNNE